MARVATHTTARAARLGKGRNTMGATKNMLICCIAPRLALQKRHLPYCTCLPNSRPFLFRVPCSVFRVPCSVFRVPCFVLCALCFAATAFAKQGTRCDDFEQALGRRFARLRTCMAACATDSTNRPSTTHSATSSTAHPMTLSLSTAPSTVPPAAQQAAVVFQPCLAAIWAIWAIWTVCPNRQAFASRYQKLLASACACSHCFYKISQQTIHLVRIET